MTYEAARGERRDDVAAVIARLKDKVASIPGMTIYFQPVQDVADFDPVQPLSKYQVHAGRGTDAGPVFAQWGQQARLPKMRRDPLFTRPSRPEAQRMAAFRADALSIKPPSAAGQLGVSLQGRQQTP